LLVKSDYPHNSTCSEM